MNKKNVICLFLWIFIAIVFSAFFDYFINSFSYYQKISGVGFFTGCCIGIFHYTKKTLWS